MILSSCKRLPPASRGVLSISEPLQKNENETMKTTGGVAPETAAGSDKPKKGFIAAQLLRSVSALFTLQGGLISCPSYEIDRADRAIVFLLFEGNISFDVKNVYNGRTKDDTSPEAMVEKLSSRAKPISKNQEEFQDAARCSEQMAP